MIPPLALSAVVDPYTTVPGAFTAARELGLVEVLEGRPVLTRAGRAARGAAPGPRGCVADQDGPEDPRF